VADTEKITINLSVVDLGQVDLLVEQGLYSSRSDLIRTAIRNQLSTHSDVVQQAVVRKTLAVGVLLYNHKDLEAVLAKGEMLDIRIVGMVILAKSITPELARQAIRSIQVYGALRASPAVKDALADRMG
jgi:metal-responsive CopG/Arc/MetJ family transcriptional regulator